jgi:hypothetical protein
LVANRGQRNRREQLPILQGGVMLRQQQVLRMGQRRERSVPRRGRSHCVRTEATAVVHEDRTAMVRVQQRRVRLMQVQVRGLAAEHPERTLTEAALGRSRTATRLMVAVNVCAACLRNCVANRPVVRTFDVARMLTAAVEGISIVTDLHDWELSCGIMDISLRSC